MRIIEVSQFEQLTGRKKENKSKKLLEAVLAQEQKYNKPSANGEKGCPVFEMQTLLGLPYVHWNDFKYLRDNGVNVKIVEKLPGNKITAITVNFHK